LLNINLNPFPEITTDRLHLRALRMEDVNEIYQLRSDPNINKFINRQPATSLDDAIQFINRIIAAQEKAESVMWIATLKDDPKLIGSLLFWHIDEEMSEIEIGYEFLPAYHGQGYAWEGVSAVIDFGFKEFGIKKIVAILEPGNEKSVKLLDKCHFQKIGLTEEGILHYELQA
jgi:ribosomal-protein-alanine N-acetyltransferase